MSNSLLDAAENLPELGGQGRRSSLEMVCDVLGVLAKGPTKPTWILQKANMSWKVLSMHLEYLYARGLVIRDDQGGKRVEYRLTQKGQTILRMYEDLRLSLYGAFTPAQMRDAVPIAPVPQAPSVRESAWSRRYSGFGG